MATRFEQSGNLNNSFKHVMDKTEQVTKIMSMELFKSVILMTPVQDKIGGRARGNWQASIDKPEEGIKETIDKNGTKAIAKVVEESDKLKLGKKIYLSNNLPYIAKLEYGGFPNPPKGGAGKTVNGFSKQAPKGMVRVSIQNLTKIFKKIVKDNK